MFPPSPPNKTWTPATGTKRGTDSIFSSRCTPTKRRQYDGKTITTSYRITTIFGTIFAHYCASTSINAPDISPPHKHSTASLTIAVWKPSNSKSYRKTSKWASPPPCTIVTALIGPPAGVIHTPETDPDLRMGTTRNPNPFVLAASSLPSASYAEGSTASSNARKRQRRTANKRSQRDSTKNLSEGTTMHRSASPSTQVEVANARDTTTISTSAPYAEQMTTEHVLENASDVQRPLPDLDVLAAISWPGYITPLPLIDLQFIASIPFDITDIPLPPKIFFDGLQPPPPELLSDPDLARVNTPYSAAAFFAYLHLSGLLPRYPELPFKLSFGFPIGPMPTLSQSYCPPNLSSALPHSVIIREAIEADLALGRLSGPFSKDQMESKFGYFRTSPIQVSSKDDGPGTPIKHRICRNLSYRGHLGFSVNDFIDAASFPTRWDTAILCASIVSAPSFSARSTLSMWRFRPGKLREAHPCSKHRVAIEPRTPLCQLCGLTMLSSGCYGTIRLTGRNPRC
jgi:hypothetical protein